MIDFIFFLKYNLKRNPFDSSLKGGKQNEKTCISFYDAQGKPWRPHIGIGGNPQKWLHNFTTPGWSSGDKTIEVIWDGTRKMVPQVIVY